MRTYLQSFLHLLFPKLCASCDSTLLVDEELICTNCLYHLPFTDFHLDKSNETAQQLWGKLSFDKAISMLHLSKSSRVELLMHRLKYKNMPEIGHYFGQRYGKTIKPYFENVDYIVPIPIHKSKYLKRGYNQAAEFARGLSDGLDIPLKENLLERSISSISQIQKTRSERYENVKDVFQINEHSLLDGKYIILVDDVLTTGATICEAGNLLIAAGAKVSVITLARA